jgi:DNA recombination protein RmuC
MIHIGRDISSLQDILKAPKLRGILGELFLEELLKQVLPLDHYALQYSFRSGEKVDAVIFLGQGMVPVDAKFPLENFRRALEAGSEDEMKRVKKQFTADVKKHIDQIASKYILPEEGTFDFALMYLPAENVYYEAILKEEGAGDGPSLSQYALTRKVIPVSPNSFYAYLQAIVLGLRGLRIEQSAKEILSSLGQLANDFRKFYEDFERVGFHLSNSKASYEKAQKRLDRLQGQLDSIDTHEPSPALPGSTPSN